MIIISMLSLYNIGHNYKENPEYSVYFSIRKSLGPSISLLALRHGGNSEATSS